MLSFLETLGSAITAIIAVLQIGYSGFFPVIAIRTESNIVQPEIIAPRVLFVGDIMLGRSVEEKMDSFGIEYPFQEIKYLIPTYDVVVANFEGTIPEIHKKTENFNMRFSIRSEFLSQLSSIGFDVLSLANNHALDYGENAYQHTQSLCNEYEIICAGNPVDLNNDSLKVIDVKGTKVGILFLHTLFSTYSEENIQTALATLSSESDIQVVFVHWGDEYILVHNAEQEALARICIDAGAETVIGHHPHVIQDIEIYNGKPIFYSLGNFIFDQYFSSDVQHGLGVVMEVMPENIHYTLIPFESISQRSQPKIAGLETRDTLFMRILQNVVLEGEIGEYSGNIQGLR